MAAAVILIGQTLRERLSRAVPNAALQSNNKTTAAIPPKDDEPNHKKIVFTAQLVLFPVSSSQSVRDGHQPLLATTLTIFFCQLYISPSPSSFSSSW